VAGKMLTQRSAWRHPPCRGHGGEAGTGCGCAAAGVLQTLSTVAHYASILGFMMASAFALFIWMWPSPEMRKGLHPTQTLDQIPPLIRKGGNGALMVWAERLGCPSLGGWVNKGAVAAAGDAARRSS
jgi:hypothetical protein